MTCFSPNKPTTPSHPPTHPVRQLQRLAVESKRRIESAGCAWHVVLNVTKEATLIEVKYLGFHHFFVVPNNEGIWSTWGVVAKFGWSWYYLLLPHKKWCHKNVSRVVFIVCGGWRVVARLGSSGFGRLCFFLVITEVKQGGNPKAVLDVHCSLDAWDVFFWDDFTSHPYEVMGDLPGFQGHVSWCPILWRRFEATVGRATHDDTRSPKIQGEEIIPKIIPSRCKGWNVRLFCKRFFLTSSFNGMFDSEVCFLFHVFFFLIGFVATFLQGKMFWSSTSLIQCSNCVRILICGNMIWIHSFVGFYRVWFWPALVKN